MRSANQTGLSAVAENIIALHLAALQPEAHRLMTVLKSRDRPIDMCRFDIVEGGIVLDADHQRAELILRDISSEGTPPPPSADLRLTGE